MEFQKRIVIYPKDVALITGRNERYGRKVLQKIKALYKKDSHQCITVQEFCDYMGINAEEVNKTLL